MLRIMVGGEYIHRKLTILIGREMVSSELSRAIFWRWPNASVSGIYDLTETGTCDVFRYDQNTRQSDDSLGQAANEIEVMTDPVTSELLIRSPFAMLG